MPDFVKIFSLSQSASQVADAAKHYNRNSQNQTVPPTINADWVHFAEQGTDKVVPTLQGLHSAAIDLQEKSNKMGIELDRLNKRKDIYKYGACTIGFIAGNALLLYCLGYLSRTSHSSQ